MNIFLRANTNQAAIQPTVRQYGLLWSLYPLGIWHPLAGWHSVGQSGMLFAANLKGLTAGGFSPLDNTVTKTISVFRLRLYWLKLHACLLIEWFPLVCLWGRTDGRSVGQTGGRTVTWLPKYLGCIGHQTFLPIVLRCALRARESSAIKTKIIGCVLCLSVLKSIKQQRSLLSV